MASEETNTMKVTSTESTKRKRDDVVVFPAVPEDSSEKRLLKKHKLDFDSEIKSLLPEMKCNAGLYEINGKWVLIGNHASLIMDPFLVATVVMESNDGITIKMHELLIRRSESVYKPKGLSSVFLPWVYLSKFGQHEVIWTKKMMREAIQKSIMLNSAYFHWHINDLIKQ
jgi:hypothetical protein